MPLSLQNEERHYHACRRRFRAMRAYALSSARIINMTYLYKKSTLHARDAMAFLFLRLSIMLLR